MTVGPNESKNTTTTTTKSDRLQNLYGIWELNQGHLAPKSGARPLCHRAEMNVSIVVDRSRSLSIVVDRSRSLSSVVDRSRSLSIVSIVVNRCRS